jgi:hypothetical protein
MQLQGRLQTVLRTNTFDPATQTITVDPIRAKAFENNRKYYAEVFGNGRVSYAIPEGAVTDPDRQRQLAAFFFWTSWAASTNRPGDAISYTHNWPHEPLVGNRPSGEAVVWTGVSILMLLAGICVMICWYAAQPSKQPDGPAPEIDPIRSWEPTPSQRATLKYFWVVTALFLAQILLGVVTAHYGVEGDGFYGFPLSKWLPYTVTRTWHVQIGLFWIATAWLAAGLFIGPLVSGYEPPGLRLGVNVLFVALLIVVVGSLAGEWLSIQNKLSDDVSFYIGHQGYEYVDLGRAWQIGLFVGLLLWVFLVVRAIRPALSQPGEQRTEAVAVSVPGVGGGHWPVLRCRPDLGAAHAPVHRRILAVVGRSPVGGGVLRGLRHHGHCLLLHPLASDPGGTGSPGSPVVGDDLPVRRHHRHLPSPVFLGNADGGPGVGVGLQCFGSRAVGVGGLRRPGRPPHVESGSLDEPLPLADLLLRGGGLLEHGGCWVVRLHD